MVVTHKKPATPEQLLGTRLLDVRELHLGVSSGWEAIAALHRRRHLVAHHVEDWLN